MGVRNGGGSLGEELRRLGKVVGMWVNLKWEFLDI